MLPPPSVAQRITGPFAAALGAGDSLQAQNTNLLVDGTIAQVNSNGRQYYLDIDSAEAPSGDDVIEPALGPGRWFKQAGLPAAPAYASLQCGSGAETLSFAAAAAPDQILAISGTDFVSSGSGEFSLTPAAGVLTYTGPTIIVQARAVASMMSIDDGQPAAAFLIVSHNGVFIGDGPFSDAQIRAGFSAQRHDTNNAGGNRIFNMSTERQITLANGDTLQVVGGNAVAHDLLINSVSLLVNQVGRP